MDEPAQPGGEHASPVRPFVDGVQAGPSALALPGGDGPGDRTTPAARPFLVTAGRTRGAVNVALESQVVATALGRAAVERLAFEYRDIVALCAEPLAVVEVAARLHLHVGVAQVLIGDLTHQGLVATYEPSGDVSDDVATILRVIHGLRARTH